MKQSSLSITSHQYEVLAFLSQHAPCSVGALADAFGVSPVAATKVVNRLERKGLVKRATDRRDGRLTSLRLTPAGQEALRLLASFPQQGSSE